MLTNSKQITGLVIQATDGEIGTVDQLYFDDHRWAIRYFVVDTGNWLNGRKVLISPHSVLLVDGPGGKIDVSLTRKQVENAPDVDTHRPVSRQHEAQHHGYYGHPYYWEGPYLWGPSYSPIGVAPMTASQSMIAERVRKASSDSHLRATKTVAGYHIHAKDGEIGHVESFIVDDETWAIRYLEVATQNWWPGKKVLLSPAWVERVSWEESKVFVAVTRETIRTCPEYLEEEPVSRDYEGRVYRHYGQPPYWSEQSISASGASWSAR